ncbi:hypothetical protein Tco_0700738 [Tanacetum coccineum]
MSSPGQIRIARRRRISGGEKKGASGNSDDGAIIADGTGKMGAIGIFGIEVVGATDTGGGELSDGSSSGNE